MHDKIWALETHMTVSSFPAKKQIYTLVYTQTKINLNKSLATLISLLSLLLRLVRVTSLTT